MNNASYAQCPSWMWSIPDPANNPEIWRRNKFSPKTKIFIFSNPTTCGWQLAQLYMFYMNTTDNE